MKPFVINAVPAYAEGRKSLPLSEDLSALAEQLPRKEQEIVLLIDRENETLLTQAESLPAPQITTLPVDPALAFAYHNATAVEKLLAGEKPIPSGNEDTLSLQSLSSYLNQETRTLIAHCGTEQRCLTLPRTVTVAEVLAACGVTEAKAIYFGYPMSLLIQTDQPTLNLDLNTDYLYLIGKDDCVLDCLLQLSEVHKQQCCGRCVFGYEGSTQIHSILSDIAQKKGRSGDVELLAELCSAMACQCLCDIGASLARLVLAALTFFSGEIEAHVSRKICPAAVCKKFVTFHILQDKCTGCGDCAAECEEDAIAGKKKFVHVIDQDECTKCGQCMAVCPHGAIVTAGASKPKCPAKPIPCKR